MSMGVLLEVLSVYVDCRTSIYVRNRRVLFGFHMCTCKVSSKCVLFTMEFDHVIAVREMSAFDVVLLLFVCNVILQELGPIDQTYLLFVNVFSV